MEIAGIPQSNLDRPSTPADPGEGASAISSDFETFIRMLTVQMQNQDPLNPVEASDFAVQLATFSTVEQQVLTNDLLSNLGSQMANLGLAQMSSWIGRNARAEMPVVFSGSPVTITVRSNSLADTAQLVVRNNRGDEIHRSDISPEGGEILWSAKDSFGRDLPHGTYTLTTEFMVRGDLIETKPVEVHDRIVEAKTVDGQAVLVMQQGQEVAASQILALVEAPVLQ